MEKPWQHRGGKVGTPLRCSPSGGPPAPGGKAHEWEMLGAILAALQE